MLTFPKEKMSYALFTGVEQEGPRKGIDTIFIVGDVPFHEIAKLQKEVGYKHLYFGAGGRFDYNIDSVLLAKSQLDSYVTVESPVIDFELLQRLYTPDTAMRSVIWQLPIVWGDEILPEGLASLKKLRHSSCSRLVVVKIDTGNATYCARYSDFVQSDYADYSNDLLHLVKEHE